MDGLAFRAAQRSRSALASIPVIGLTAFPIAGVNADFDCLRKPLRFDRLVERILTVVA